jgi:integrase/recombinase XerD
MTKLLARDPMRRCLKPAEWPEEDRQYWTAALRVGDIIDGDGGVRASYRSITNRNIETGYGRWLGWLAYFNPHVLQQRPSERITNELVLTYVSLLETINGSHTILSRLKELYGAARVMGPGQDWRWIRKMESKIRARHRPVRPKRNRLVASDDLLGLGMDLMASTDSASTPRLGAIRYRDGLLVAFLSCLPLRRKNLADLELYRTLTRQGTCWLLLFEPDDMKNGETFEIPWPDFLVSALETYLSKYRPLLTNLHGCWRRPVGNFLWVSSHGSPMSEVAIYNRICDITREAFGKSLCPHLFRDSLTTTIAIVDPNHISVASQLLHHKSAATIQRHYNQARAIEAARNYQAVILELRRQAQDLRRQLGDSG